jgi:hypothetical protein
MSLQHGVIKAKRIDSAAWRMNSHIKALFNQYTNEPHSDYVVIDYQQLKTIYNRIGKAIANKNIEYISDYSNFLEDYEWEDIDNIYDDIRALLNKDSDPQFDIFIYWTS